MDFTVLLVFPFHFPYVENTTPGHLMTGDVTRWDTDITWSYTEHGPIQEITTGNEVCHCFWDMFWRKTKEMTCDVIGLICYYKMGTHITKSFHLEEHSEGCWTPSQCAFFWFDLSPSEMSRQLTLWYGCSEKIQRLKIWCIYSQLGIPTFSGSRSPQVVNSPQDKP